MGMGANKRRFTDERLVHLMKELERLEKRIDLGGQVAIVGAILSAIGAIVFIALPVITNEWNLMVSVIALSIGPVVLGVAMCIVPSPWAIELARLKAQDEAIKSHWLNRRKQQ